MARDSARGTRLFYWLFIVIGLAIEGAGVWTLIHSLRTRHWPATDGVIQSAHVQSHSGSDGRTYSAVVTYTYSVAGVSYEGDKISIGQISSSSAYAQRILDRYPVGKEVLVHYSPTDPAVVVLETGVHGGTWLCFGIGTAFVLSGVMFLRIQRTAARAQLADTPQSSPIKTPPDGSYTMDKPPVTMGVIFLLAGVGICCLEPDGGTPRWIGYAAGGFFGLTGLFILLLQLKNAAFSKIAMLPLVAVFLAIFHWVSFGAGERIGTSTTLFSQHGGVNVRLPFAIFTILLDLALVAGLIRWLTKRRDD
jgi:hypothetical protein